MFKVKSESPKSLIDRLSSFFILPGDNYQLSTINSQLSTLNSQLSTLPSSPDS
ncbi:MAG: hypothetical protein ACRC62_14995 [Microcoleus sp.]